MISFNIRIFSDAETSPAAQMLFFPDRMQIPSFLTVLKLLRQLLVLLELPGNPLLDRDVGLKVFDDFLY